MNRFTVFYRMTTVQKSEVKFESWEENMKKVLLILFILGIMLVMAGCDAKDNSLSVSNYKDKDSSLIISNYKDADFDNSGDIILSTQHQVYGKDIERITCFIQNKTDKEYTYGQYYAIEKLLNDTWYKIPFIHNETWFLLAHIANPKSTVTEYVNLTFSDYTFTDGTYRIIKKIDDKNYYAKFELGESNITASTPYGFEDIRKLKKNYSREQAIADGAVVITNKGIENSKMIGSFIENVSRNTTSMLRIMQFTTEGSIIVTDITYHDQRIGQDSHFTLCTNELSDKFDGQAKGISETIYSYMITDGSSIYLSNYAQWNKNNYADNICIVEDLKNDAWKDTVSLVEKMTEKRLMWNATTYKLFSPEVTKNVILTKNPLEFGYSSKDSGEMRYIENKMGLAVKIDEVIWVNDNTLLLVCKTNSDMKYFEFFDTKSRSLISYKASVHDYYFKDGEIIIPE